MKASPHANEDCFIEDCFIEYVIGDIVGWIREHGLDRGHDFLESLY